MTEGEFMETIAILTDFGLADTFTGIMRGVIFNINPKVNVIDISHLVQPQNIHQAAFLLRHSYKYFPKGTIFMVVVDPGVGSERKPIIIRTRNYFFVAPDNGVLSLAVSEDRVSEIVAAENEKYFLKPVSNTFHGRDIFSPVAAHLSKGTKMSLFGPSMSAIKRLQDPKPKLGEDVLCGEVIYTDRFGNLITNITRDLLDGFTQKKAFKIVVNGQEINSLSKSYQDAERGVPLALFGSFSLLEISVNMGSAEKNLDAHKNNPVEIKLI